MASLGAVGPAGMVVGATAFAEVARELTPLEVLTAVNRVVANFSAASRYREQAVPFTTTTIVLDVRPGATQQELRRTASLERQREAEFRRRQILRIRRDVARTLREPSARRRDRLESIARREAHYDRLRAEAIAQRSAGTADALNVLQHSPEGALWQLGPRENHCPGCAYLAGHALPWSVLREQRMVPPLGPGCGCRLQGVRTAWLMGETPQLARVLDDAGAMQVLAQARALGHAHRHDGGITVG